MIGSSRHSSLTYRQSDEIDMKSQHLQRERLIDFMKRKKAAIAAFLFIFHTIVNGSFETTAIKQVLVCV